MLNIVPNLKHGIREVCAMVEFICMGFDELKGTQSKREIRSEKFLVTVGFESSIYGLEVHHATYCATRELLNNVLK